jgi:hypothetical protein
MGLESVTDIADLNVLWPLAGDERSQGDDHLRNIKVAVKSLLTDVNQIGLGPASLVGKAGQVVTVNPGEDGFDVLTELGDSATKNVGVGAGDVAAGNHNHSGVYSLVGHNHDADYAALSHNHDSAYAGRSEVTGTETATRYHYTWQSQRWSLHCLDSAGNAPMAGAKAGSFSLYKGTTFAGAFFLGGSGAAQLYVNDGSGAGGILGNGEQVILQGDGDIVQEGELKFHSSPATLHWEWNAIDPGAGAAAGYVSIRINGVWYKLQLFAAA